jgi:hypothetical protein
MANALRNSSTLVPDLRVRGVGACEVGNIAIAGPKLGTKLGTQLGTQLGNTATL